MVTNFSFSFFKIGARRSQQQQEPFPCYEVVQLHRIERYYFFKKRNLRRPVHGRLSLTQVRIIKKLPIKILSQLSRTLQLKSVLKLQLKFNLTLYHTHQRTHKSWQTSPKTLRDHPQQKIQNDQRVNQNHLLRVLGLQWTTQIWVGQSFLKQSNNSTVNSDRFGTSIKKYPV